MPGLGRRLLGAAMTGYGAGIVEEAKAKRQETLIKLRSQLASDLQGRDLVKTVGDDGLPVWTPKSEAAGKLVPTTAQKDTLRQLGERYNPETKTWEKIWGRYVPDKGMVEVPNAGAGAAGAGGGTPATTAATPDADDEGGWWGEGFFDKFGQWISFGGEDESAAPEDIRPIQTGPRKPRPGMPDTGASAAPSSSIVDTAKEKLFGSPSDPPSGGPRGGRPGMRGGRKPDTPAEEERQRKPSPYRKPQRHPDAEWDEQHETWFVYDSLGRKREVL